MLKGVLPQLSVSQRAQKLAHDICNIFVFAGNEGVAKVLEVGSQVRLHRPPQTLSLLVFCRQIVDLALLGR